MTLAFDKYVPELTGDQVRDMLSPVFDFKALNQAEAYEKTLPPKVQEAIKNHKVLVGMDRDMVIYAKGRPPKKIRDKDDKGQDYEEWIYGDPPQEVEFVRFQGAVVARLEIMTGGRREDCPHGKGSGPEGSRYGSCREEAGSKTGERSHLAPSGRSRRRIRKTRQGRRPAGRRVLHRIHRLTGDPIRRRDRRRSGPRVLDVRSIWQPQSRPFTLLR